MKVYLSGITGVKKWLLDGTLNPSDIYALESFYSFQEWQKPFIHKFKDFLLDSGAFTFMSNIKKHNDVDWISYADQYADFIKEYNIHNYFELDIDSIKDMSYVEMLRNRIEKRSGIQSIPVWHKNRGQAYFVSMCKDYPYVALGGMAKAGDKNRTIYEKTFPWFIKTAHQYNAKIHGLGYTKMKGLEKFRFDSVDSTTWTGAGRFGVVNLFSKGIIVKERSVVNGERTRRIKNVKQVSLFNFKEWIKYSKYADEFL